MSEPSAPRTNRLILPLVAVSLLCVAQAVVIAFLLGRGGSDRRAVAPNERAVEGAKPAATATPTSPPAASSPASDAPASGAPASGAPAVARGKVGRRVESGGLAVTAVAVSDKPRYDLFAPRPGERFLDVDVLLECDAPGGVRYFASQFKVQDDQARVFDGGALGVGDPQLGFGTLVQGTKARGHVAFVLPKDAKGLTLTYPAPEGPAGARAIQIDLGP